MWRERQILFKNNGIYRDTIYRPNIIDNVIVEAYNMITNGEHPISFPAKSYITAIVYAEYISSKYDELFYDILNMDNFLIDDPFFIKYSDDKTTYETIIELMNVSNFKSSSLYNNIVEFCKEETD